MAFENLGEKLTGIFKNLRGKVRITEKDVKDAMREVKLALLEADVNFKVVKDFINTVSDKVMSAEVLESLTPAQNILKTVREELTELMGAENARIEFSKTPPTVIMMCGLQGAGKTTASAKLALHMRKTMDKRPLLVACDIYRPAAIKQLEVLGNQVDIAVSQMGANESPVTIADKAVEHAKKHGNDPVIIDTAGRLQIDDELMTELENIKKGTNPAEILLVIDAMIGQDAVNVAETFNERLGITGVILSKLDGDARGGAALSVKAVTGKPIKFVSMGEKLSELEPFYPDRMAGRILGMGDVMTLIDKAQEAASEEETAELERKLRNQTFNLDDFLGQLQQIKKMGSITKLIGMMPGVDRKMLDKIDEADSEKKMKRTEAIIQSMTQYERENPKVIAASRKVRIAKGSGTRVQDVNELLKQVEQMNKMMKQFSGGKQARMMKKMKKFGKRY
ncbi:MAG: signal recognition particle protein [Clostridia bacterium]|nr:signal recognition particle protein [Clostridia bacterium]